MFLRWEVASWRDRVIRILGDVKRLTRLASLMLSTVISNAILFGGLWLLSKFVPPSEFGLYSVAMAIAVAIYPLLTLRMEQAIPIAESESLARATTMLCVALSAGLLTLMCFALVGINAIGLNASLIPPSVRGLLVPTTGLIFTLSLDRVVQSVALRKSALATLAVLRIGRAIALVGLQLLLLSVLGTNANALLGGQLAANAVLVLVLTLQLAILPWFFDVDTWRRLSRRVPWLLRRFRQFPLVNTPHTIVHGLLTASYGLLIGSFYGSSAVGQYYMMQRMVFGTIELVSAALLQQGIAEAATREPGRLKSVSQYIVVTLLAVTLPTSVIALFAGEHLFSLIMGKNWAEAGIIAAASIGRIIMEPIASSLSFVPNFLKKQREAFAWSVAQNLTGIGILVLAHHFGASVTGAIAMSATGMAIVMILFVIWLWRISTCTVQN